MGVLLNKQAKVCSSGVFFCRKMYHHEKLKFYKKEKDYKIHEKGEDSSQTWK